MAADMPALLADLADESQVVHDMLASCTAADWETPTPAPGWAVRDQVSHLAFFDEAAVLAATEPERFRREAARLTASGDGFPDEVARRYHTVPAGELAGWFRRARDGLLATFAAVDPRMRMPWYGPEMSAASAVTARLMETWAHGQDIADTLGVDRPATGRLYHVAHLGVRTFAFSFGLAGRVVPGEAVRVELDAPDGSRWEWGPPGPNRVAGPALDFCLVVTQRRHVDDTALVVEGPVAAEWMGVAQAYAGGRGAGRPRRAR